MPSSKLAVEVMEYPEPSSPQKLTRKPARMESPKETTLAGFHKGSFFIRDAGNRFRFSPKLRLQVDAIAAFPEKEAATKPTVFIRRARPEVSFGLLQERMQVYLTAEVAKGGTATDAWIRAFIHPWFSIQVGQFTVPFSLETITSDKYIDFMERAAINTNLTPAGKEPGVMVFGGFKDQLFVYHMGLFNGSGRNASNENGAFDFIGRLASKPLVRTESIFSDLRIGGSIALSPRDESEDQRISIPVSKDWLQSSTKRRFFSTEGIVVDGLQTRFAAEVSLPIEKFLIRSEAIIMNSTTHIVDDVGNDLFEEGALDAFGLNLTLGYWIVGKRILKRYGGVPTHKVIPKQLRQAKKTKSDFNMQVLVRGELLSADFNPGRKTTDAVTNVSNDGNYQWLIATAGTNLWWTKHFRLSFNYTFNHVSRDKAGTERIMLHELGTRAGFHF